MTQTHDLNAQAPTERAPPGVPFFWPLQAVTDLAYQGVELFTHNLRFLAEEERIHFVPRPEFATPSTVALDLRTLVLRDYSLPNASSLPTIVDAPFAGHSAVIADYHDGQSLMQTLRANGVDRVFLTDWKSATPDMKDLEIDQYLAELNTCVDDLGGRVNLVGLCQGGWMSAMYAARFPEKVASLVLAGSPIDTDAGDGPIKRLSRQLPLSFYQELVDAGGGLMLGKFMLQGWKSMHPEKHYVQDHFDIWEHVDDPAWIAKTDTFKSWYEHTVDLPGRWYLQAIQQIFKENRFARGEFVGLGRTLSLSDVTCPTYLLAGELDDITTSEQVFNAEPYLGTPREEIVKRLVPGGHIGLFLGSHTLREAWPGIARWIVEKGGRSATH